MKKQGFIYPWDVHRPFGHMCMPKKESGTTCQTIPTTTHCHQQTNNTITSLPCHLTAPPPPLPQHDAHAASATNEVGPDNVSHIIWALHIFFYY